MDFVLENSADPDEMLHMQHFIWVFTVCKSTALGFSGLKRVKKGFIDPAELLHSGMSYQFQTLSESQYLHIKRKTLTKVCTFKIFNI